MKATFSETHFTIVHFHCEFLNMLNSFQSLIRSPLTTGATLTTQHNSSVLQLPSSLVIQQQQQWLWGIPLQVCMQANKVPEFLFTYIYLCQSLGPVEEKKELEPSQSACLIFSKIVYVIQSIILFMYPITWTI